LKKERKTPPLVLLNLVLSNFQDIYLLDFENVNRIDQYKDELCSLPDYLKDSKFCVCD
jgi:hypothetical protein